MAVVCAYVTKKSFTFCLKLENCVMQIYLKLKKLSEWGYKYKPLTYRYALDLYV